MQGGFYMKDKLLKLKEKYSGISQVSDMLYQVFKDALICGIFKPGCRLKEEELADIFQVSRTPVRETIKRLENEGLVTTDHVQGTIVKKLMLDECLDTLEVLEWLRTAAIDFLKGRIPRSFLMRLEANMRHGETLTDPARQYENNLEFHFLLIKATGNTELIRITERLQFKEKIIAYNILPFSYEDNYVEKHRRLIAAIIDNDKEYLEQYSVENNELAQKYMNQLILAFLEGGENLN